MESKIIISHRTDINLVIVCKSSVKWTIQSDANECIHINDAIYRRSSNIAKGNHLTNLWCYSKGVNGNFFRPSDSVTSNIIDLSRKKISNHSIIKDSCSDTKFYSHTRCVTNRFSVSSDTARSIITSNSD